MKFLTAAAIALSLIAPLSQAATTLKIATLAPDGTNWMKEMRKAAATIKKETEGRVSVKYFPGGVQGSDSTVLRKMRINQLQGGMMSIGALADVSNVTQLYSLPFTFRNLDEVSAVREEFDPYITDTLAEKGYVILGLSQGGFAYLMSDTPLKSSVDVRNKKVWVPEGDRMSQTIFENGGVQPISLPVSDVYTSLQTGLIDTVAINPSTSIALQWHTKVNYATDFPLVFLFGMLTVSDKAFSRLSDEDQAIVKRVMRDTFAELDKQNAKDEEGARQALIQNGMEFVQLTEEDRVAWRKLAADAKKALAADDVYPVETYNKLVNKLEALRAQQ
ncbi:MAG: C4-dicarboxylate ABC transporter [Oceanospirillaceae bacterium]|uniref:TRAP transporter substrate-binding protein n=1 Tax=unclassified Thalassolituus TaxID=2624967 RepID=UPI000C3C46FC|nr:MULTISPECIES: TRAP transporter substrate-binding protein DctP [unclassified Thalassolituus]MAS25137.1 C4-dicarboxylate ABC transporter [Oceanospirillaceae bacterium]MBL36309.1 C4-dicarboxylate ABC transporter [Oceanospirillaceae bacterium]MBS53996.1 C4-dicarboxylate ABC transporter [Oceanospirillaceae bacterium]